MVAAATPFPTLRSVVERCCNSDPWSDPLLVPLLSAPPRADSQSNSVSRDQIGFLRPRVVRAILKDVRRSGAPREALVWSSEKHGKLADLPAWVAINPDLVHHESRTPAINALVQLWRQEKTFPDPLDGWRDELYDVYASTNSADGISSVLFADLYRNGKWPLYDVYASTNSADGISSVLFADLHRSGKWPVDRSLDVSASPASQPFFALERSACALFGVATECAEEAGWPEELVRPRLQQVIFTSYFYQTETEHEEGGWIQPEVEFTYALELPKEAIPTPEDGEAESFELMSIHDCLRTMRAGAWKANTAPILLQFLLLNNLLHVEDESLEGILQQVQQDLKLPGTGF
ncbi:Thiamine pyrophosphokinase [Ceraceosorus bombacis]|uniref:Thiamine pyrophosphokinase n=1 Tax=Ceraceosorus bombacis TaxID=401625 RepID=A0A0P1BQF1_9BASI|nr:Thiamine pyrophosphokinase [Ceraceosorus bombacis]